MLVRITKARRAKAAIAFALAYLFCVLAPPAAFAFSHNPDVARCLIEGHVGIVAQNHSNHDHGNPDHGKVHVHADGTAHQHHDHHAPQSPPDPNGQALSCCGLFSVVGLPEVVGLVPDMLGQASIVLPARADALTGRGPERINRPPIV